MFNRELWRFTSSRSTGWLTPRVSSSPARIKYARNRKSWGGAASLVAVLGAVLAPLPAHPTDKAPLTLRIEADDVAATNAMEKVAQEYESKTGVRIVVEKFGYASSMEKASQDLASKAGQYDIIIQNGDALRTFASNGSILNVDALEKLSGAKADFENDLFAGAWRGLSWYKGKRYGYPLAANTMLVVYRRDLIENPREKQAFRERYGYDLAPPADWKQYRDLAEFFTRPEQGFYGTLLQGKRFPAVWFEWLNFAFSFGGGVMDKEYGWEYGPVIINSPATVQATEFYQSLKAFSVPGVEHFTWDDAVDQMRQGHIFMCLMWSDALSHLVDPATSRVVGKLGYAPIPAGKAGRVAQIAGSTYFVSRYSSHPKESFLFELWMMGRENQISQEVAGGASARRSVFKNPQVVALPYAEASAQSLVVARSMIDTIPEAPQVSDIIETAVSDVLSGKQSSKEALDRAAIELNQTLGPKAPLRYPAAAAR